MFDFFWQPDINQGVYEYLRDTGAVLLDVRTPHEYQEGHIPGSFNLPLQELDCAEAFLESKETPLYVYCRSGSRSRQAAYQLQDMGFEKVKNIGGILEYSGKVES